MPNVLTDDATRESLERGTASLPDLAGDGVRSRLAALLHQQVHDESANSVGRGVLAIGTAVAAMVWPELSLSAMLVVFGAYAVADAALAAATAVAVPAARSRLATQAGVDIAVVLIAVAHHDFTRTTALRLLAVWVVVMGALRLRDAIHVSAHRVRANVLLAVLAMLAITAGAPAIVAPHDHLEVVMINVWIFTILRGVTLVAGHPRKADLR